MFDQTNFVPGDFTLQISRFCARHKEFEGLDCDRAVDYADCCRLYGGKRGGYLAKLFFRMLSRAAGTRINGIGWGKLGWWHR